MKDDSYICDITPYLKKIRSGKETFSSAGLNNYINTHKKKRNMNYSGNGSIYDEESKKEKQLKAIMKTEYKKHLIDMNKIKKIEFTQFQLPFCNIHEIVIPSDGTEGQLSSNSSFSYYEYRYKMVNKKVPNVFRYEGLITHKFISELLKTQNVPEYAYSKIIYQDEDGKPRSNGMILGLQPDLFLYFDSDRGVVIYYDKKYEDDENSLLYKLLGLIKSCKEPKVTKNKINIVYRTQYGFEKMGFDVKKIGINLKENYNDDFESVSNEIIVGLNDKKKTNLVILSGEPGTGKTTYIRYLTSKIKKNIIFISPDMVDSITDPAFIPFLMKNDDSVLIIEDAEPALQKRDNGGRSSAVSNVLNLTDGLLSDCLKISIVATFNTDKKTLDEALLRKGRLLMNYKFEKLIAEKSKVLLEKLGHKEIEVKGPMSLADIYYYGKDNNVKPKPKRKKIGFNQDEEE